MDQSAEHNNTIPPAETDINTTDWTKDGTSPSSIVEPLPEQIAPSSDEKRDIELEGDDQIENKEVKQAAISEGKAINSSS